MDYEKCILNANFLIIIISDWLQLVVGLVAVVEVVTATLAKQS